MLVDVRLTMELEMPPSDTGPPVAPTWVTMTVDRRDTTECAVSVPRLMARLFTVGSAQLRLTFDSVTLALTRDGTTTADEGAVDDEQTELIDVSVMRRTLRSVRPV